MAFWPRGRFPFIPNVGASIAFQQQGPIPFNNPAWDSSQTAGVASPFLAQNVGSASPWAQNILNSPTNEKGNAASPWLHGVAPISSSSRSESRSYDDRKRDSDRGRRRRSRSRERRSEDRDSDRKSRRRSYSEDDDSDYESSRKSRHRDRSPVDKKSDRSRSGDRNEGPSKKFEGDKKFSFEAANYKNQTPNETIMIRGLAQHINEDDIQKEILKNGIVPKDIRLIRKKETGVSRGFAFVEFKNTEDALCWMTNKQGVLLLNDADGRTYRAVMQFSIVDANLPTPQGFHAATDWFCSRCNAHNFKRRLNCYKCHTPRPEAGDAAFNAEVSPHPTTKLVLRNLDPLTNEEELLKEISSFTSSDIPIQSCEISREPSTNLSRGVCYMEMKNVLESIKLYNELTSTPFLVRDKTVSINYCKLTVEQPPAPAPLQQQQYSLADVPRLAEYSARLYASTPAQKTAYLQYYTQYYTNQIAQASFCETGKDTNSAAAVAATAIQLAQTKKAVASGIAVAAASNVVAAPVTYLSSQQIIGNTSLGEPDASGYVWDENSSHYYDSKTGLYYDPKTQYFYHSQDQVYLYWDVEKRVYALATGDSKDQSALQAEAKDEKKKDKEKSTDKVKVAKRIAKDMERWAKTMNQKKEVARMIQVATQQAHAAAKSAATADIAFSVLERQEAGQLDLPYPPTIIESPLVGPYGGGSDSEEAGGDEQSQTEPGSEDQYHTDWSKIACLLCKRQFPTKDALQRHQQLSDLHRQNLESWYRSRGREPPPADNSAGTSGAVYRDRARERRLKFGDVDEPPVPKLKEKLVKEAVDVPTFEVPNREGISSSNKGSKMLQKMGWSEGMGLGKTNQGRTEIVQAVHRVSSAGLGVAGSNLGPAGAGTGNSYKENVKRAAMIRFSEMYNNKN